MRTEATEKPVEVLVCSDCFQDHGLSLDARSFGVELAAAWRDAIAHQYVEGTRRTMISDVDTEPAHGVERSALAERR